MFEGAEKINAYGRFLHHTVGTELWLVRLVLLAAVILHVVAAVQLTRLKQAARPAGYRNQKPQARPRRRAILQGRRSMTSGSGPRTGSGIFF